MTAPVVPNEPSPAAPVTVPQFDPAVGEQVTPGARTVTPAGSVSASETSFAVVSPSFATTIVYVPCVPGWYVVAPSSLSTSSTRFGARVDESFAVTGVSVPRWIDAVLTSGVVVMPGA